MQEQFLQLYDQTVDDIFEYCYGQTGDRNLAKTITEDTFIMMWDNTLTPPQYPPSEIKKSLHLIASHFVKQYARQHISNNYGKLSLSFS